MSQVFQWNLGDLLKRPENGKSEKALIILNQPLKNTPVFRAIWTSCSLRLAADGGANRLYESSCGGLSGEGNQDTRDSSFDGLDMIIGDLDSLRDEVREYYSNTKPPTTIHHDPDQNSTDFGKAVGEVRRKTGASDIVAIGSIGGRVDQGISQLHHLYVFQPSETYAEGRIWFVSEESLTILLKAGMHRINVKEGGNGVFGKHVGIIPLKEPSVITTRGLEWDVQDWETSMGGQLSTSNHVLPDSTVVEIETTRDVLFTIAMMQG